MPIQHQIEQDYLTAFKGHDQATVDALRFLKAAIKNREIELREGILSDQEIIAVLTREAKRRQESITMFTKGDRAELAAKETLELELIRKYLPAQMTDDDLVVIVKTVVAEMNPTPKDFGKVMSAVMAKVKGQADGNRVSAAVKAVLK